MNNNIYLLKLKIWSKCSEKVQVFSFILTKILLISLFLTSDFRRVCWVLHWLLVIVSVRYQNRPCLGREWVIDHQYLRRFRCNNRVLQNNAFYGKRCIIFHLYSNEMWDEYELFIIGQDVTNTWIFETLMCRVVVFIQVN